MPSTEAGRSTQPGYLLFSSSVKLGQSQHLPHRTAGDTWKPEHQRGLWESAVAGCPRMGKPCQPTAGHLQLPGVCAGSWVSILHSEAWWPDVLLPGT